MTKRHDSKDSVKQTVKEIMIFPCMYKTFGSLKTIEETLTNKLTVISVTIFFLNKYY